MPLELTDIADLLAWFRRETLAGLADGDPIASWEDSSGNGHDAAGTDPDFRPVYATVDGQACADNTALTAGYLDLPAGLLDGLAAGTGLAVVRAAVHPSANSSVAGAPWSRIGAAGQANHYSWTTGDIYDGFGSTARYGPLDPGTTLDRWHLLAIRSAADGWRIWIDGTLVHFETPHTVGWNAQPRIFGGPALVPFVGSATDFALFSSGLSDADRQSAEGVLAHLRGIQGNLPVDHPYRDDPPGEPGGGGGAASIVPQLGSPFLRG